MANEPSKSLRSYAPRGTPCRRLVCFPHAGASAAVYRPWALRIDPRIEVLAAQLPGRGDRMSEPSLERISEIVESILPEIEAAADVPLALFGHSMGATLAFEVASALTRRGHRSPTLTIVSARRPPVVSDNRPRIGHLPDLEFLAQLEARYGPIPAEVRDEPEVLALFLPILKADIRALEHHESAPASDALNCPIHAWGGRADHATPIAHLEAWSRLTRGTHDVRLFEGGHFYLQADPGPVLRELESLVLRETSASLR